MRIKMELDIHPADSIADSWDTNGEKGSRCGGYDTMLKLYPDMRAWLKSSPPDLKKTNGQVFDEYFAYVGIDDTQKIEPVEIEKLGAILLAKAEIRFQTVALLAQKGLNTNDEEQKLLHLKEALLLMTKYQGYCVAAVLQVKKLESSTAFGILRTLPENVKEYIRDTDTGRVVGCVPIPYHQNEKLYILVPTVEDAAPPLKLGFDGKNFIAVYTENLPKLPEGVMKMLALPATQEAGQPPASTVEERVHGDVMEHKHPEYDYWHPVARKHPKNEEEQ